MAVVLIIDDEEGFLHITEVILQRAGYTTLRAVNAVEGLSLAYERCPDVIILDDMMPGLSGSEVCRMLKSDPERQHVPIIMHSAASRMRNPDHVRAIRADAVLLKPTMPKDLVETVSRFAHPNGTLVSQH